MTQAQQPEAQRAVELQVDEIIELACEWRSSWLDSNQSSDERGRLYEKFTSHLRTLLSGKCLLQIAEPAAEHIDDLAVGNLAYRMKAKLAKQRENGYGGWDTDCTQERLSELLRQHVDKGDPVDVANFCAFLLARGEGIAAAPQAVQPAVHVAHRHKFTDGHRTLKQDVFSAIHDYSATKPEQDHDDSESWESWFEAAFDLLGTRVGQIFEEHAERDAAAPAHPAEGVPAQVHSALADARAVLLSINRGDSQRIKVGDDVCYWQRDEWVQWAIKEVLPLVEAALAATQPAAQGMDADLTDEQIDEAFNQMPDGAAGFLKSWGYRQFARAVLAAQAKQGGA